MNSKVKNIVKKKIKVILQAETRSEGLYGKSLLPILNEPLVILCWNRLKITGLDVVVTIPNGFEDDYLATVLKKNKVKFYRTNPSNVLQGFKAVTKNMNENDIVIRVTVDNPFVDGFFLNKILSSYLNNNLKYFSSCDNIQYLPNGMNAEIFQVKFIRELKNTKKYNPQYLTSTIKKKYLLKNLKIKLPKLKRYSNLRLTINYFEDFIRLNKIFCANEKFKYDYFIKILDSFKKNNFDKNVLKPSKFVLGTAQLGKKYFNKKVKITNNRAYNILKIARKEKINYLDTAYEYGKSEKFIGNYSPSNNKKFYIISKLKNLKLKKNTKKEVIMSQINESIFSSLSRLKNYYFDNFLIHNSDNLFKKKIVYTHLKKFLKCGIIKNLGVSIYSPEEFNKLKKFKLIKSVQIPFSILDPRWISILKKRETKLKIFVRSIFLRGNINKNNILFKTKSSHTVSLVKELNYLKHKFNRINLMDLSLAYVKSFKRIDYFVIGIQSHSQLSDIIKLYKKNKLDNESRDKVIEVIRKYLNYCNIDLRKWS